MQFMPQFGLAGAETMCENLTYELINQGHNVCVVSFYDYHSPITCRLEQKGVPLVYLYKKSGFDFGVIKKVRNAIKEFRPDILHTHLYILKYVALASVGLPIKGIVHTVHNIAQKENNAVDRFINRILFKKKNIVSVALSNEIRKTIHEVYKLPINNIPVVFNGVTLNAKYRKDDYSPGNKIQIINIGRYTNVKNQLTLIEAVKRLHANDYHIKLDIYGDGPLKAQINQKIRELNAEEYIHENGLTDNVTDKLINSDIFVLPSIYEGMPMTIIEAMAVGLPVVASNVGGIPDMIKDNKNGLLCGTDIDSIYYCILRLIKDNSLRETIGKNAVSQATTFSSKHMANSYFKIYSKLHNTTH